MKLRLPQTVSRLKLPQRQVAVLRKNVVCSQVQGEADYLLPNGITEIWRSLMIYTAQKNSALKKHITFRL